MLCVRSGPLNRLLPAEDMPQKDFPGIADLISDADASQYDHRNCTGERCKDVGKSKTRVPPDTLFRNQIEELFQVSGSPPAVGHGSDGLALFIRRFARLSADVNQIEE